MAGIRRIGIVLGVVASGLVGGLAGAQIANNGAQFRTKIQAAERPLIEGTIQTLVYLGANGQVIGALPDVNAALDVNPNHAELDRHGRFYRDVLIVTNPRQRDFGVHVIPADRIIQLVFDDE